MLHVANESDSFKNILDRNGVKIHIGEQALVLCDYTFIRCQVIGFSKNYKDVYLFGNQSLYKRRPNNIVIVHNLQNWKNKY
jgi:hypothetical protein